MIIALLCAVMILIIPALILERKNIKTSIKKGGIWIALYGIFNGLCNFLVILLAAKMSASVMYPLISAGGIILSYIVARFVYKEKLAPQQNIGVICGIIAVILLNL